MYKPLATVLSFLDDGVKEDGLIANFNHLIAPFSQGGRQRMAIEVVKIYENFFMERNISMEKRFPRLAKLVREKREDHERSMAAVDVFLKGM